MSNEVWEASERDEEERRWEEEENEMVREMRKKEDGRRKRVRLAARVSLFRKKSIRRDRDITWKEGR